VNYNKIHIEKLLLITVLFSFSRLIAADPSTKIEPGQSFRFGDYQWVNTNKEAEIIQYKDKEALQLKPDKGDAIAYLQDFEFVNGIIELDIAAIPHFTGLVFRVKTNNIYEGVYFRPQNSRHNDPVKQAHTVQYLSHPLHTWYYLREKYPGKYESAVDLPPDEWFHVKVEVTDSVAKVFVNEAETPCLVVNDLKQGISTGTVGVWCGNGSGGTYANLKITTVPVSPQNEAIVNKKVIYTPEQKFLFDIFKNRRSVRKFKSTPVPDEHLLKILDIARTAPTAGNQQPWKFLVIQDRDKLDQLKAECVTFALERYKKQGNKDSVKLNSIRQKIQQNLSNYLSAPVYVSVLVDTNSSYPKYNIYDGSLAAGYLMIAARSLGYGTVFTQDTFPYEIEKKVFEIPGNFVQICFTPIGIPETWPDSPNKKPLDEFVVFEKFIQGINYTLPVQRIEIKLDTKKLEELVGQYELNPDFIITISLDKDQLYLQATGQQKLEIFPESETEFFLKVVDAQIIFQKKDGNVTGLILYQANQEMPAKKIK